MINSAHEDHYDISWNDGLVYVFDAKQNICVAIPSTNIPQFTLPSNDNPFAEKPVSNIEKARAAKAAKKVQHESVLP